MANKLFFITGNESKYQEASAVCQKHKIGLQRLKIAVSEIQSEHVKEIAEHKAHSAYVSIKQLGNIASSFQVVVNDAEWSFAGIKGFPGVYMAYVNQWFNEADWQRLLAGVTDTRVVLTEAVTFFDGNKMMTFEDQVEGHFVKSPVGEAGAASDKFIALDDSGITISQQLDRGNAPNSYSDVWEQFAQWYDTRK